MKLFKALMIAAAIGTLLSFFSTTFAVSGSGNIVREARAVSDFNKVSIEGSGILLISQGGSESFEIETDDNLLPYIATKISSKTLRIYETSFFGLSPSKPIIYRLSLKSLSSLDISGSTQVQSQALKTHELEIELSGSAEVNIEQLESETLDLEISGSGIVSIAKGRLTQSKVEMSGSGRFISPDVKCDRLLLEMSGSGSATVWITDKLDVSMSGNGHLSYFGNPKISSDISGSGKIIPMGEK